MKICTKCNRQLPLDCFSRDVSKKDKMRPSCRDCDKKVMSQRYHKSKEKDRKFHLTPNIEGFPEYHISTDGVVINRRTGKTRKARIPREKGGYPNISLYHKGISKTETVHRLVAQAYIPNPKNKPQVNHINGKKDDNRVVNLEWTTASENTQHAHDTGLVSVPKGKDNWNYGKLNNGSSKGVICTLDGIIVAEFASAREAVRQGFATLPSQVSACCKGKRKHHKGYEWRYTDERNI